MPITSTNPFKGRHFPGEVILLCVLEQIRGGGPNQDNIWIFELP
jgi:hypothetical protein